ncbi:MAG: hypothetical protein LBT64_03095 [Puniceicoccales bacterium]|jgi:hypothetical protein|nr:hypothetical protein [Puniceicoccales bacterium]
MSRSFRWAAKISPFAELALLCQLATHADFLATINYIAPFRRLRRKGAIHGCLISLAVGIQWILTEQTVFLLLNTFLLLIFLLLTF